MTAKEKAKELFDSYSFLPMVVGKKRVKQCVLIAVEEIIKSIPAKPYGPGMWDTPERDYWKEVKESIREQ